MKKGNVILLPTDFSRIVKKDGVLRLTPFEGNAYQGQNMYLTSDEPLKVGDWYIVALYDLKNVYSLARPTLEQVRLLDDVWVNNHTHETTRHQGNCKKIIATTDKTLLIEGIPSIESNFIEYFCETQGVFDTVDYITKDNNIKIVVAAK